MHESRRRIIEQAVRLFAAHGFAGTTTRQIARATGLVVRQTLLQPWPANESEDARIVHAAAGGGARSHGGLELGSPEVSKARYPGAPVVGEPCERARASGGL